MDCGEHYSCRLIFNCQELATFWFYSVEEKVTRVTVYIDLFHNGGQIKYSFVLMLISLSSLATTSKFQKNFCFKMRAAGLINIASKECKGGRHL